MYSQENYFWGLVVYGLGFLLIVPALYHVLRVAMPWRPGRVVLWILVAVLLLTPVRAYTDMDFLAPAWVVALFEFVRTTSQEGPARAITPMVVALGGALLAAAGGFFIKRRLIDPRRSPPTTYWDDPQYRHGEGEGWHDGRSSLEPEDQNPPREG